MEERASIKDKIVQLYSGLTLNNLLNPLVYTLICIYDNFLLLTIGFAQTPEGSLRSMMEKLSVIQYFLEVVPLTVFYIVTTVFSAINLLLPVLFAFLMHSHSTKDGLRFSRCAGLLLKFGSLYNVLLVRPLCVYQFHLYFLTLGCSYGVASIYPEVQCWQGEHLAYSMVTWFALFAMLANLFLSSYLMPADCYPESLQPWAGTISYAGVPLTVVKMVYVLLYVSGTKFGVALLAVFVFFAFQRATCKQFYYHENVTHTMIVADAFGGIFGLGICVCTALDMELTWLVGLLLVVVSIVFAVACLVYKAMCLNWIANTPVGKLGSPSELIVYFVLMLRACKSMLKSNKQRMRVWAAICNHQTYCANPDCDCRVVSAKLKEIYKAYYHIGEEHENEIGGLQYKHVFAKKLLGVLLKDALDKFGDSVEVRLLVSYIEDKKMGNFVKGYYSIMKAVELNPTFACELAILMHKQIIEKNLLSKKQEQGIDVKGVWLFERNYQILLKDICTCGKKCVDFWTELLQISINITRLYSKSIRISELYLRITETVQQMLEIYPDHTGLLRDYAQFLAEVVNNDVESAEYMEQATNAAKISAIVKTDTSYEDIKYGYNSSAVTLAMSGNIGSTGIIQNSNDKILQFGYSKNEVIGNNVSMLMPKYVGDMHDGFILNYFNTGVAPLLNHERVLFIQHKSGYLEPIYLLIKCLPHLQEGLCFLGFLKRLSPDSPYLQPPQKYGDKKFLLAVTDPRGCLLGFTRGCFKQLGLVTSLLYDGQRSLQESSFSVKDMNPELLDPKCEAALMTEGLEMQIRTDSILNHIEFERLSQNESMVIAKTAGAYTCYVQLVKHEFATVSFRIYKILVLAREKTCKCSSLFVAMTVGDLSQAADPKGLARLANKPPNKKKNTSEMLIYHVESSVESTVHGSTATSSSSFSKVVKEFKRQICNNVTPSTIANLNRAVIFLMLLLVALAIVDLYMRLRFTNEFVAELKSICMANNRRTIFADIATRVRSLVNIQAGLEKEIYQGENRTTILTAKLEESLTQLQTMQIQLDNNNFAVTGTLQDYFNTRSIVMYRIDSNCNVDSVKVSANTAIGQIVMYTTSLLSMLTPIVGDTSPLLNIGGTSTCLGVTPFGKTIYFILENVFGSVKTFGRGIGTEYVTSALINANSGENYLIILMVISIVFVVLCVVIVIPILVRAEKNKVLALSIYSQLPVENAKKMLDKCRHFLEKREGVASARVAAHEDTAAPATQQNGTPPSKEIKREDSIVRLTPKEPDNFDDEDQPLKEGKKEEKSALAEKQEAPAMSHVGHEEMFKNFHTNIFAILVVLTVLGSLMLGYMGISYYLTYQTFAHSRDAFNQVFDITSRMPSVILTLAVLRENIIRNSTMALAGVDQLSNLYLPALPNDERRIKEIKASYSPVLADSMALLERIDSPEVCSMVTSTDSDKAACLNISGGVLANGIKNAIYNYASDITTTTQSSNSMSGAAKTKEVLLQMLNDDNNIGRFITKDKYIDAAVWLLQDSLFDNSKLYYDNVKVIDVAKAVAFIVGVLIIISVIWTSFISGLKRDVFRARGILNLLPTDFIMNNEAIRKEVMRIISF